LARLAAVFETFVAGAAIRRATMAASLLSRVADPEDVRALRLALRALDSRAANALLGRGAVRLRDLSADVARRSSSRGRQAACRGAGPLSRP
jgi:hypothetical protein